MLPLCLLACWVWVAQAARPNAHVAAAVDYGLRTKKNGNVYPWWVFFLISLESQAPHVRTMGRTCGEPDKIELTPHWGGIKRLAGLTDATSLLRAPVGFASAGWPMAGRGSRANSGRSAVADAACGRTCRTCSAGVCCTWPLPCAPATCSGQRAVTHPGWVFCLDFASSSRRTY